MAHNYQRKLHISTERYCGPTPSYSSLDFRQKYSGNLKSRNNINNKSIYDDHLKLRAKSEPNLQIQEPVSLKNIGANCYMNSGLQALSACSSFVGDLKKLCSVYKGVKKLDVFLQLILSLTHGNKEPLDISKDTVFQNWNKFGQQDSFELLSFILNEVFDQINSMASQNEEGKKLLKLPLQIITEHKIKCCLKSYVSTPRQFYLAFHIPLSNDNTQNPMTLQYLLDRLFLQERIEDYQCTATGCDGSRARQQMKLCQPLPSTICIHLQRMIWKNGVLEKIDDQIEFQSQITIKSEYYVDKVDNKDYFLKSVVVHYGSATSGHYICYKLFKGSWFRADDSNIYPTVLGKVLNSQAYILFYEETNEDDKKYSVKAPENSNKDRHSVNTGYESKINKIQIGNDSWKDGIDYCDSINVHKKSIIMDQIEDIIEALSFCQVFVEKVAQHTRKNDISKQCEELFSDFYRVPDVFSSKDILPVLDAMLRVMYDRKNSENSWGSPFNISVTKFKSGRNSENFNQNFFQLNISSDTHSLSRSFDSLFGRPYNYFSRSNNIERKSFVLINKPLPEVICIQILLNDRNILFDFQEILLQKSFLSSNDKYGNSYDYRGKSFGSDTDGKNAGDSKYLLKSIIRSISPAKYEVLKINKDRFQVVGSLRVQDLNTIKFKTNDILFFERQREKIDDITDTLCPPLLRKFNHSYSDLGISSSIKNECHERIPMSMINRSSSKSIKNVKDGFYLKLVLHSFSSCSQSMKSIENMKSMKLKSRVLLELIRLAFKDSDDMQEINRFLKMLNVSYDTHFLQFLLDILQSLEEEWSENPFSFQSQLTFSCKLCKVQCSSFENNLNIDIPVTCIEIDVQKSLDDFFSDKILIDYFCENCKMESNSCFVRKLGFSLPKTIIFHIGSIVWNGKEIEEKRCYLNSLGNVHINSNRFEYSTTTDKRFSYQLKSIISFDNNQFSCFKYKDFLWYHVTETSIGNIRNSIVNSCKPNIMFYELLDVGMF